MSPLKFQIVPKSGERISSKEVEISHGGGGQDIRDWGVNWGHVMYPGDVPSDKGAETYIRTVSPAQVHRINFEVNQSEDIELHLPEETVGNITQLTDRFVLRVKREG